MLGQKVMVRMESRWKELCCAPPLWVGLSPLDTTPRESPLPQATAVSRCFLPRTPWREWPSGKEAGAALGDPGKPSGLLQERSHWLPDPLAF